MEALEKHEIGELIDFYYGRIHSLHPDLGTKGFKVFT